MIIRLTDIIKSYAVLGYDYVVASPSSLYLCHHVCDILNSAGMRSDPDGYSYQFFSQWCEKVLGLNDPEILSRWSSDVRYNIMEDWNARTKFGPLAFTCEFMNEGIRYNFLYNGRQYRTWVLGHVLAQFGDIQFEFSEGG